MPFIQRIVEPVFLSRPTQQSTDEEQPSAPKATHDDFTSIANCTLANILRQLASVVLVADEILSDLGAELQFIRDRSNNIQKRIVGVEKSLENVETTIIYKSKQNFVDNNDVSIYKTKRTISTSLFTASSRPQHIQQLYEQAAPTPVMLVCDTSSESNFSSCPTFGHMRRQIRRKIDAEIETRVPAAIDELRKWTSAEAIGEITVAPNCLVKVGTSSLHNNSIAEESYASFSTSYVDGIDVTSTSTNDNVDGISDVALDHKLPSPEEQCKMIAQKYPAEIVRVNTSNVRFERMCSIRKSLGHVPMGKVRYLDEFQASRRSLRPKKASGKRRNTIAGIDDKDIKEAYSQMRHSAIVGTSTDEKAGQMPRSKSNDLLRSNGTVDSLRSSNRFSNFKALKQWGKYRLRLINKIDENVEGEFTQHNSTIESPRHVKPKSKTPAEKSLKQNPLYSSTEKLFTNVLEMDGKNLLAPANPVKLRSSMTRRQRRNKQYRCEEPNSSSGNWSASSESGRTSASSEVAMQKKSSNSCNSLNHNKSPANILENSHRPSLAKRRINTSTSSSITSDDTAPNDPSGYADLFDDNESMYSCDTEGYFTSFHVDSGLKTLKEEESNIVPALLSTSALLPIDGSHVSSSIGDSLSRTTVSVDSDYELFGKGSTSTTASSGTVCSALLGSLSNNSLVEMPVAPERKSSLNSKILNISNYGKPKALMHKSETIPKRSNEANQSREANSTDNNNKSENGMSNGTTISDIEISENSDFEGVERVKRIRGKTQMNSNRIPSICIITPINSDDEDRVAAMESMLSSLNINQKDLPLNDLSRDKTVVQIHNAQSVSDKPVYDQCADSDVADDEYVTITDVGTRSLIKVSDVVSKDLERVLSGDLNRKTEYVSLNELPCNANYDENLLADSKNVRLITGTNVKLNANGMFVYDSNTLRYKRSLCTTFKGTATDCMDSGGNVTKNANNQSVANIDNRMSAECSPTFEKMDSDCDSTGLDDVYVTLATDKCELNNSTKPCISVSDSELSDTSRDAKSDTWPVMHQKEDTSQIKRRFSWENLTKSKDSKRKSQRRHRRFLSSLNFNRSKMATKSKATFKTSTPLKGEKDKDVSPKRSENSFGNSTSISQVTMNRPAAAQSSTCSDRLGVPKTSLNDFKRLLLNATNKKLSTKPSAVEQLKLKHDSLGASPMKILDLSGSPKSFTNRRVLQLNQTNNSFKKPNLMSPRSRWKYSNFNKNSIASIPEANVEDDVSVSSTDKSIEHIEEQTEEDSAIYATPQKKTATCQSDSQNDYSPHQTPIGRDEPLVETESSPETGIIETNFSFKENLFLQTEENNFMPGEIKPYGASLAKKFTQKHTPAPHEVDADVVLPPTLETSF